MENLRNILKKPLFLVSSLNAVSVGVRIAGGLLASKVIAVFIGPAGMAVVENLRNFLTSLESFATLGFQNGIIKYTAEYEKDGQKLRAALATIFITIAAGIIIMAITLPGLAKYWGQWVFGTYGQYAWVFRVLGFTLPLYAGNLLFMAVLNGLGQYRKVIALNIWGNISGVLLSALLIWKLQVSGAFLGLILYPSFLFFFSCYLFWRSFPQFDFLKWKYFDIRLLRGLFSYSLMTLVSAVLGPVVYLSVRTRLIEDFSPATAGFWAAVNRISVFYLLFVTTLLTVYFLPRLSAAQSREETRDVLKSYYKGIVPVFAAGLLLVFFLKHFIIRVLFSAEFLPMADLFAWQLAGDFFKVCALILGYQLFAKKMTRAFIVTEMLSFAILYSSSHYLVCHYGAEGAVMAHAVTYFAYLAVLSGYFYDKLR